MKINNPGTGFVGIRLGVDGMPMVVVNEADHFCLCNVCGQAIDRRDLGQVFHHDEPGHKPIQVDA